LGQVISQDSLILQRQIWKGNGQSVVLVSGCFDLLHPGHIRLLEQARAYGDILLVGVQSDAGVRASKGHIVSSGSAGGTVPRPITPAIERAEILAALAAVDYVTEFDGSPDALVARLAPDTVVYGAAPGGEAPAKNVRQDRASGATGANSVAILLEPGYSTESLLERIVQRPA